MTSIKLTPPGTSSQESAITLLRDAVLALRRHPRDPGAQAVANRIHSLLSRFPTHFVVEYLAKTDTGAEMRRVPLSDWPEWADGYMRDLGSIVGDGSGQALPPIDPPDDPTAGPYIGDDPDADAESDGRYGRGCS
jgi:hypothetical protein